MIISHSSKFIFLHTPKTAGSSITTYMESLLQPKDFTLTNADGIRFGTKSGAPKLGSEFHATIGQKARMIASDLKRGKFNPQQSMNRARAVDLADQLQGELTHPAAKDVRKAFPVIWNDYFKFCFVRNPYAHAVSFWKWRTRNMQTPMSFAEFLKRLVGDLPNDSDNMGRPTQWGPTGWKIYTIDDEIAVNHVAKMENLHDELEAIFDRIGIPFDGGRLPHRLGITNANATYREYYGGEEMALVERMYFRELQTFNYEF